MVELGSALGTIGVANLPFAPTARGIPADKLALASEESPLNPVFEYTTPGTYTVTLLVTARSGCVKEVKEIVVVKESSKVTIVGPAELCAGENATFTSSATITNGVQWNWDFKNGQTATIQNPAAQMYNTAGSYHVTLIVNNQGCLDTAVRVVTVNARKCISLTKFYYIGGG